MQSYMDVTGHSLLIYGPRRLYVILMQCACMLHAPITAHGQSKSKDLTVPRVQRRLTQSFWLPFVTGGDAGQGRDFDWVYM